MGGAMAAALTAAQMTVKEILEGSTQRDLLAYTRAIALPGASKSTRKQDLVSNLMDFCDDASHKQSTCTDLLAGHGVRDLCRLIARLRGLGCLVRLGQKPRRNDLVAAIASVDEYAPSRNPGPSTGLSRRKGLCLSAGPVGSAEKPSAIKEGAGPQESMALVACDTAADPGEGRGAPYFSRGQRAKRKWQTWIPSCRECCKIMAKPPPSESCAPWWDERWASR